ncbi:MAG TPA: DinB family protein [Anaerolineae bacterium]|nr:DinB family protein [Anaerolineae bacterium]
MSNRFLAEIQKGWGLYQKQLVKMVRPLDEAGLAVQMAPHMWSVGVLVAHIVVARVWWWHYVLGEGPVSLAPMVRWDEPEERRRDAAELVSGLEETWGLMMNGMSSWSAHDLEVEFAHPRRQEERYTRQWVIWHLIEHDIHHGGEISYMLGASGRTGLDL